LKHPTIGWPGKQAAAAHIPPTASHASQLGYARPRTSRQAQPPAAVGVHRQARVTPGTVHSGSGLVQAWLHGHATGDKARARGIPRLVSVGLT
jgi:hypothetical protein